MTRERPSINQAWLDNVNRRDDGSVIAACPACRASGSDKTGNHLKIEASGKFGCVANPGDGEHRKEIFRLVGIKSAPKAASRIVATYDYTDANGKMKFQEVRKEPKDFLQRQPDGKGGWTWNLKGVELVLFRLPEINRAVAKGTPIFLCEGCKDVLAMARKGFAATCNPMGAGKWRDSYTETLKGADVCIIADRDKAGRDHAQLVASKLNGVAKSVRVIELPDTNGKPVKDAHDFFTADGTPETIFELVDAAPTWTPQATPISNRADVASEYLGTQAEAEPLDIGARLAQVRFNILTPPPLETAVFTLSNGTPTHTRGNISAITAQAKAGKSAFLTALAAGVVTDKPDDCDLLGWRAVNSEGLPLAILDTEHSPAHNWKLGDRILRRAMLTESPGLHLFRLAGFNVRELNAALDFLLKERKWHSVFLDGTGDFVSDVNDAEECNAFVARLHGLAIEHDTHIFNVLHLNPSSETKSRGHLGSQLERKAETNLRIEKKDGVSIVYSDRNRGADIPKDAAPRFVWSADKQMHVLVDAIGKGKLAENLERLREQRDEAFRISGKSALFWSELREALQKVPGIKSESKSDRILRDLKTHKLVTQNILKQYVQP